MADGFGGENTGIVGPLDMDQLFQAAVNEQDVRDIQEGVLKPNGSYTTIPVLNLQASRAKVGEFSTLARGRNEDGRVVFRFYGPAQMIVDEKSAPRVKLPVGTIVKGQFGFAVSPDRANKLKDGVDSGEPDGASQRWAQAVKAYEVAYKAKPASNGDVVRYLENYPVIIRVIQVGVATERNPEPDGEPSKCVTG